MTTKPKSTRHAKPTTETLLSRIDRKLNERQKYVTDQLALLHVDIQSLDARWALCAEAASKIIGDIASDRDSLRARCDRQEAQMGRLIGLIQELVDQGKRRVAEANRFMSTPVAESLPYRYTLETLHTSKPPTTGVAFDSVPTLRVIDTAIAAPQAPHDIRGPRCRKCGRLKAAIEATGEGCTGDAVWDQGGRSQKFRGWCASWLR